MVLALDNIPINLVSNCHIFLTTLRVYGMFVIMVELHITGLLSIVLVVLHDICVVIAGVVFYVWWTKK